LSKLFHEHVLTYGAVGGQNPFACVKAWKENPVGGFVGSVSSLPQRNVPEL
jgi:hypothetical protein